jgi:hypothetical protein
MEAKLAASIVIGPDALRALAANRAAAVRVYLLEKGQVPAERVFLSDAAPKEAKDPAPRVWLELK